MPPVIGPVLVFVRQHFWRQLYPAALAVSELFEQVAPGIGVSFPIHPYCIDCDAGLPKGTQRIAHLVGHEFPALDHLGTGPVPRSQGSSTRHFIVVAGVELVRPGTGISGERIGPSPGIALHENHRRSGLLERFGRFDHAFVQTQMLRQAARQQHLNLVRGQRRKTHAVPHDHGPAVRP